MRQMYKVNKQGLSWNFGSRLNTFKSSSQDEFKLKLKHVCFSAVMTCVPAAVNPHGFKAD